MKLEKIAILSILSLLLFACSSSEQTTNESNQSESQPEVYVFDDVVEPADSINEIKETIPAEPVVESTATRYYVQVGAFTTKERAEQFFNENSSKISYPMNISYSDEVKLFVVQLPAFSTREEAEKIRNELWQISTFKDAFIVTK